jgi:hypothetical protein
MDLSTRTCDLDYRKQFDKKMRIQVLALRRRPASEISEGENGTHGEDILPLQLELRTCGSSVGEAMMRFSLQQVFSCCK